MEKLLTALGLRVDVPTAWVVAGIAVMVSLSFALFCVGIAISHKTTQRERQQSGRPKQS
jgi:hypothetical protein